MFRYNCGKVKMVFKTFILLLTALSFTSSQQMTCTYSSNLYAGTTYRYQCDLSVNNPDGLDDAVSIGGVHSGPTYMDPYGNLISTYNDLSVQVVRVIGITKNIPSAICRQFPNAEVLNFYNAYVQILSATKCSKLTELRLSYNFIENSLVDLCQFQPALRTLYFNNNKLKSLSDVTVKSCKNLVSINVDNNQISSISSTIFTNTPTMQSISIGGNPISAIPNGIFNGLTELKSLAMSDLLITDLPLNIFSTTKQLNSLSLANNRLVQYRPEWFQNLNSLIQLYLDDNTTPIPANFFKPMPLLRYVSFENCNISVVYSQWFASLTSLFQLRLYRNNISELPDNTFAATTALKYLDIRSNKLKIISSKWFSDATLQSIGDFNLDDNEVNAIDPKFFALTTNLNSFSLNNNKCYTGAKITDFLPKRSSYMPGFQKCIDNFAAL